MEKMERGNDAGMEKWEEGWQRGKKRTIIGCEIKKELEEEDEGIKRLYDKGKYGRGRERKSAEAKDNWKWQQQKSERRRTEGYESSKMIESSNDECGRGREGKSAKAKDDRRGNRKKKR